MKLQLTYGLSIHHWPAGHALDAEEAIQFTEIEDINCMIEKFPLQKANDAFGESLLNPVKAHC
jgi:hypothetical protein